MEFSQNIYGKNFVMNNSPQFYTDDLFYANNEYDDMNQSRSYTSILTGFPHHYNQNVISSNPHQNHPFSNFEIPSNDQFMGMTSYSNTNVSQDFFNNKTPAEPRGISGNLHGFQGNTMCGDTVHDNQEFVIKGHEPTLDQIMVQSQPSDLLAPNDIKGKTKEVVNQPQDQLVIKTDQSKNKAVQVKRSKPSKKADIIKGTWSHAEDRELEHLVEHNGTKKWTLIAKLLKGRVGKQCRERWHNHLRPNIKKNSWSEEEDQILIEAHKKSGNKWTEIAQKLPGRSENTVKNHWNATKRKLNSMKAKRSDENANPPQDNYTLLDYIKSITIADDFLEEAEAEAVDEVMDPTMLAATTVMDEFTTEASAPVPTMTDESTIEAYVPVVDEFTTEAYGPAPTMTDESTIEAYVPVPATPIWKDDDFTGLATPATGNSDDNVDQSMQAATTVMDGSGTEVYFPVPETPIWYDFGDLSGPMDETTEMLFDGFDGLGLF